MFMIYPLNLQQIVEIFSSNVTVEKKRPLSGLQNNFWDGGGRWTVLLENGPGGAADFAISNSYVIRISWPHIVSKHCCCLLQE